MSNDCRTFRDQIADFVTGVLPEPDSRELQEHLSTCAPCRDYMQTLMREDASLTEHFAGIDEGMAYRQERTLQRIECSHVKEKTNAISIWRGIMKNRYGKLATTAAILVFAVGTVIVFDRSSPRAYALTELAGTFDHARTIHVHGSASFPDYRMLDGSEVPRQEEDSWIDLENGRLRRTHTLFLVSDYPKVAGVSTIETVMSGEYKLELNHRNKVATFFKGTDYQRRLYVRADAQFWQAQIFGDPAQLDGFKKVGAEEIDGIRHDVWLGESVDPLRNQTYRFKFWVLPATAELTRTQSWLKGQDGRWQLWYDYRISQNEKVPEETFALTVPEEYAAANSKEQAEEQLPPQSFGGSMNGADNLDLLTTYSFTLKDGSVILGWSSVDRKSKTPPDAVFKDVRFGGPTPAMPVEIYGLKPACSSGEPVYAGRHLGFTKKADRFIEWALFVPNATPPWSVRKLGYDILYRFHRRPAPDWAMSMEVYDGLHVETAQDFDTWVLGGMAELSDTGTAPSQVTYQAVLNLVRQIRSETKR